MIKKEIKGDLFKHLDGISSEITICIPHIVNNIKVAGSGFIVPLFKAFPEAKTEYLKSNQQLKDVSYAFVGENKNSKNLPRYYIANMCAQDGIKSYSLGPRDKVEIPGKYAALINCMEQVDYNLGFMIAESLEDIKIEIHTCRFGSDRAGLNWNFIKELINEIWKDYDTYIYYL